MSDTAWTVGRYVVETLAANGIDTVFGIPGVHNLELYRGLELARLRHVLARHEQNAGFAADGYARAARHPAAAFVISGPGLTNALTALAQAFSDSVPLLLVASAPLRASLGRGWGVLHELADQRALAASVTGFAGSARSDEECREHLRSAFAALRAARPRPAYLDIPLDLLAAPTELRPEIFPAASPFPAAPRAACGRNSSRPRARSPPRRARRSRPRRRCSPPHSGRWSSPAAAHARRARSCGAWSRRSTRISSPRWRARAWLPRLMRPVSAPACPTRRRRSSSRPPTW